MGETNERLVLLLVQGEGAARDALASDLSSMGHRIQVVKPDWADLREALDRVQPDAFVVDASVRASHARECAAYLRERKATRDIPLLMVGVQKKDLDKTLRKAQGSWIVEHAALAQVLKTITPAPRTAQGTVDPVASFRKRFDLDVESVALVGEGQDFRDTLRRNLGPDLLFTELVLCRTGTVMVELTKAEPDLEEFFRRWQSRLIPEGRLWVITPKKEAALRMGIDWTWEDMQAAALKTDLVDTKTASFSAALTATRFVIRHSRRER